MCGRFTLKTPTESIAVLFPGYAAGSLPPRYNIAPTQSVLAVRQASSNLEFVQLRWGLVPSWAADLKIGAKMINARSETVGSKPSFRAAFKRRRCLVVADGYYEWKMTEGRKQPYYISGREPPGAFCMAGLWEKWSNQTTGQVVESCAILTTAANSELAAVHDRMPVVIEPPHVDCWLNPEQSDGQLLQTLLHPAPPEFFRYYPVATVVNNPRHDTPECVRPV